MDIPIEHLARLARLALSDEEQVRYRDQLGSILHYMETLNELDTSGIEATSHVISLRNVMREDSARPSLRREDALRNAPDGTGEFYRVPKIIE